MHLPVTPIDSLRILEEMSDKAKEEFSLDQFSEAETDEEFGLPEFKEHFADTLTPAVLRDWTAKDFASIYVRFRPHLERHARRFLVNPSQVEEVVQDAFLYLMTTLPELDSELGVLKFLKWKVRLLCLDVIRLESRRPQTSLEYIGDIADSSSDASESLERADDAAIVAMALAKLPPRQREALLVTLHQGKTNEEASRTMGLTPNAFRQLIFRARASFKRELIGEVEANGLSLPELLSLAAKKAASSAGKTTALISSLFLSIGVAGFLISGASPSQSIMSAEMQSTEDTVSSLTNPDSPNASGGEAPQVNEVQSSAETKSVTIEVSQSPSQLVSAKQDAPSQYVFPSPADMNSQIMSIAAEEEDELLREMLEQDISRLAQSALEVETSELLDVSPETLAVTVQVIPNVRLAIALGEIGSESELSPFTMISLTLPNGQVVSGVPQTTLITSGSDEIGNHILEIGLTDFVFGDFTGGYGFVSSDQTEATSWKVLVRFTSGENGYQFLRSSLIV